MPDAFDIIIAGGAAMGGSLAYWLAAEHGIRALVIEPDPTYARAASALSMSSIRQQFSTAVNIRASLASLAFLREAQERLAVDGERPQIGLKENGYLYLAGQSGAGVLKDNHAIQRREGADIALLDRDGLAARFPWLALDGIAAGAFGASGEGWFDGYGLTVAYGRKARALGATFRRARVVGLDVEGGRVRGVALDDGTRLACGAFVDAAGASGARQIAALAGLAIPVRSRKRCVFAFTAKQLIADMPLMIDASGVYVRPEGQLYLCGVSPPEEADPDSDDFDVDWPLFEETIWPALAARVPLFEEIRPGRAWAGHYDLNLFDHNAIVGRAPGFVNFYFATGFSGHGIQQSPAIGRGLAELIATGGYRTLDLGDFSPERIAAGRPLLERNVI